MPPDRIRCPAKALLTQPEVSVIMLVLHDASFAARCLDSISASTTLMPELIVIANGTPDAGLQPLAARDDITLVHLAINLGFGRACNVGATIAVGRNLVFLNDDTVVEPGWLESLLAVAAEHPTLGAVGSKLLFPDGRLQDVGGLLWRDGTTSRIGWGESDRPAGEVTEVDYCSGCSMLVPRSAWLAVGGFDRGYFPAYYEDADLCMRLRRLGLSILCQPASRVRHHESASSTVDWRTFISDRNRERFVQRWHAELREQPVRPAVDGGSTGAVVTAATPQTVLAA